ncbi:MAG: class I SAM-dependent methyltransferase [Pseudomonadota bacterium]
METRLNHGLELEKSQANRARERFASSLRAYVLHNLAGALRDDYEHNALPEAEQRGESAPTNGPGVHKMLKGRDVFNLYSSMRCTAQELVWNSVIDSVNANSAALEAHFNALATDSAERLGSVSLDADLETPRYVAAIDVHLMPGNYDGRENDASMLPGAVYDNGFNVFAFGAMGKQLNDIGCSMANFVRLRFPELSPTRILDVGCTIGHNTLPWKQTFPAAEVHGVDIAGACVKYAHARAESLGIEAHFHQQTAETLNFDDASFDVVFSSMFLHELPLKSIRAFLTEAHRLLRPGGVMLHMELPPNDALTPFDAFYLDWDGYYNNEPFYKNFRDQDYRELCAAAGFAAEEFFDAVMPRYTYVPEDEFAAAVTRVAEFDEDTGRLSDAIQWYGFGARKSA